MHQLALIISCLILFIEGALLVFSLQHEKNELLTFKENLEVRLIKETGKSLEDIYPGLLDGKDIQERIIAE